MSKRKTVKTVFFCADNAADVAVQLVEFSKNASNDKVRVHTSLRLWTSSEITD